jgi:hypothetical protein
MNPLLFFLMLFPLLLQAPSVFSQDSTDAQWERKWEMKPGVYRVLLDGKVGIVDDKDQLLVPCQFDQVYGLDDDNYVKVLNDLKIGLYHIERGLILPAEYDQIWPFENGMAKVLKNRRVGYVDQQGATIIPCEYNHIWPEQEGIIKVLQEGKSGLLDTQGNILLPVEYQQIWPFENNRAKVLKNGKMGLIDNNGREVVPPIYDQIGPFSNGIAMATMGNERVYIDPNGQLSGAPTPAIPTPPTPPSNSEWGTHPDSMATPDRPQPALKIGREQVDNGESYSQEITIGSWPEWKHKKKRRRFEGHLSSVNLGINGYFDEDMQETVPDDYSFMSTIHEKSIEFSVYPVQKNIRLIGSYVGLVTAIGLKYNNYRFDLGQMSDINELARPWFPDLSDDARISKSKLTTLNLSVPLVFEVQIPEGNGHNRLYLSGGIEGNLRLKSHTKLVFREDGDRDKRKRKNDFGLNGLRYNFIARAGYNDFGIYATYSPVSMFKSNEGPELYPYSVGVSFNFD